jgi:two-component system chemotaxis sensor kinase CheA
VLEELFRSFHSIKGISGMVELREAEMLAHQMESYLRALRQRDVVLSQRGVDALIAGVQALERRSPRGATAGRRRRLTARCTSCRDHAIRRSGDRAVRGRPSSAAATWRVTFTPSAERVARGVNVDSVRARLRDLGTIVDATPRVPEGIAFEFCSPVI